MLSLMTAGNDTFALLSVIAEEVVLGPFGGVLLGCALNCGMRTLGWRRRRPRLSPDATGTEPLFAPLFKARLGLELIDDRLVVRVWALWITALSLERLLEAWIARRLCAAVALATALAATAAATFLVVTFLG